MYNIGMGILNTTKKKGIPVKTKIVGILITLVVMSTFANIKITVYGKAITEATKTSFYVTFHSNVKDSVFYDTVTKYGGDPGLGYGGCDTLTHIISTWQGTITIKKKGFSIGDLQGNNRGDSLIATSGSFQCRAFEKPPTITKTKPIGSTLKDTNITFQWKITEPVAIIAESLSVGHNLGTVATIPLNPADSIYSWTPQNSDLGSTVITIKAYNADTFSFASYSFTLVDSTPPKMDLTSPKGGETWETKTVHAITWTATDNVGVARRVLSVSLDSGKTWIPFSDTTSNTGTFNFILPDSESNPKIKIVAFDAAGNKDSTVSGIFHVKKTTTNTFANKNVITGKSIRVNNHIVAGLPMFQKGTYYNLKILNLQGSLIGQETLSSQSVSKKLIAGEYLIQVTTLNKVFHSKTAVH
jgi:hypothetical protein